MAKWWISGLFIAAVLVYGFFAFLNSGGPDCLTPSEEAATDMARVPRARRLEFLGPTVVEEGVRFEDGCEAPFFRSASRVP